MRHDVYVAREYYVKICFMKIMGDIFARTQWHAYQQKERKGRRAKQFINKGKTGCNTKHK